MPLTVTITLPFGRYSATPWGRHVNEGDVEWPPSPWRLVRALTASWHINHPDLSPDEVVQALELLCGPPAYTLPPSGRGTTRHYMPDAGHRRHQSGSTDLVLNAFVATQHGAQAGMHWTVEPNELQMRILTLLAGTVTYLGRAESRVRLDVDDSPAPSRVIEPTTGDSLSTGRTVRLLVPRVPLELDSVHATTAALQRQGRSTPDHTDWSTYLLPQHQPDVSPQRPSMTRRITMMQFAILGRGRPGITEAALLASEARRTFNNLSKDVEALHGHDEQGNARQDGHRHAHYLVVNDGSGARCDRLVVWTPEGIPVSSAARLTECTSLDIPDHLRKRLGSRVDLALEVVGTHDHLDPRWWLPHPVWVSSTPFTTRRHRKPRRGRPEFLEDALRRQLAHRGMPSDGDDVTVDLFDSPPWSRHLPPAAAWYRARRLGRDSQQDGAFARLTFAEPLDPGGPLVLGSLAHFGLGLFTGEPAP